MSEAIITIPTDIDTARRYNAASHEEQQKIQILLRLLLFHNTPRSQNTLQNIMDIMSSEAESKGLTPAILDDFF